jgi:uncharacterized protein (TIGR03084 family)
VLQICADLSAEHDDLDRIVVALSDQDWDTPTPSPGWTIRDQISHLWFFDEKAMLALTDPHAFAADVESLLRAETDPSVESGPGRALAPRQLLDRWRDGRSQLVRLAANLDPSARVPWYGPPMAARSFVTARLMETWAHGQDVADAIGVVRLPTNRLRHVAHLGVRTRPFSYAVRGVTMPDSDVSVRLVGPDGDEWTWGEAGNAATDVIAGPALDFCLVVTQRRNIHDTALQIRGAAAAEWMQIAQAYAGPAGPGRAAGQFDITDR